MDYIFGTVLRNGVEVENLKTISNEPSDLSGYVSVDRKFVDSVITDNFRVVKKYRSFENGGLHYDFYEIDTHYRYIDRTPYYEPEIKESTAASSIMFVTMAESGAIDDVTAGEHAILFSAWAYPVEYKAGQIRRDPLDDCLYRVNEGQDHTSQSGWNPSLTPSMWSKIADPAEEWPEWSQPLGAHDSYDEGAQVTHNGKKWLSTMDNNVFEPGIYGWSEAS